MIDEQNAEMTQFATSELLWGDWMRAQSLSDRYANFSDRTDHGPYGAYDGWPPLTIAAFARQGNLSSAEAFFRATIPVTLVGPYGQAHGVRDSAALPAYKPFDYTLYNELAGGGFADVLITSIFGLQPANASLAAPSQAPPPLLLPHSPRSIVGQLSHVRWQGQLYSAASGPNGVVWVEE